MTVLAIILFIILFISSWILFMPLVVDVDTTATRYCMYQAGTFQFYFENDFQPRLRVLGMSVSLKQKTKPKAEIKVRKKSKTEKIAMPRIWALVRNIFRCINIKRFTLTLDTGDVVFNAKLIPAFVLLSRGPVQLSANFNGRVSASLLAEVRLYRLVWVVLKFFTKK
ncbi:hypothetical protein SanaruYs_37330 [Chryseotalea sanaruensis]|uniref:DUF2953 domain-containing protein n=1 Tax=Chryseotalea sanaruensis TaxID=2482724 RepID=A0A401UF06_9BACT|nr:hypothetical protein [Chryseotalea sanaruensis]GCC53488.1 hypothetical protein SanaruYs_37330 [Chryseotalea sanaruensis]